MNAIIAILACTFILDGHPDVGALRENGQRAVDELYAAGVDDELLDSVCAQKDCRASRLFWTSDLEEAKIAARAEGKPILSLHMLGRLDEELSCANSRFFRTILYPDPEISALMREHFVLHWHTVRPVPKVTIEMGDGRVIRQTITGNSAHFLLDAEGRALDVLPGMISPRVFRKQLEEWIELDRDMARTHDRRATLDAYHQAHIEAAWDFRVDVTRVAFPVDSRPTAKEAQMRAAVKSFTEMPLLRRLDPKESLRLMPEGMWEKVSESEKEGVVFSESALTLMRRKQPVTEELLETLRGAIAADSMMNQFELHYRIHEWFLNQEAGDADALNERIYAELFLTPLDDPWMGLKAPAVFMAVE